MDFNTMFTPKGPIVAPLPKTATQASINGAVRVLEAARTKRTLLDIAATLLIVDSNSTLWKTAPSTPYKVSLATLYERLCTGKSAPNALFFDFTQCTPQQRQQARSHTANTAAFDHLAFHRPLAHFEDLYYAIIAKIKDMHFHLTLRLENGFATPETLICPGGPPIAEFESVLRDYWHAVNYPTLVKALYEAVQVENMWKARRAEVMSQLTTPTTVTNMRMMNKKARTSGGADAMLVDEDEVPGLSWMHALAPGMIFAELEEKYRLQLVTEKKQKEQEQGMKAKTKAQAQTQTTKVRMQSTVSTTNPETTTAKPAMAPKKTKVRTTTMTTAAEKEQQQRTKRKRDPLENDNYESEKAWRNGYGEGGDKRRREALKKDFLRLADRVQYWGRKTRCRASVEG